MTSPQADEIDVSRSRWPAVLVLFSALAFVAYFPVWNAAFIWDDDNYVTENLTLRTPHGLFDIWLQPSRTPQYYPLVHTTFWIEYHLWGLNPTGYHIVNIALHVLNSLLLFLVIKRLRPQIALIAATIFLLHPVHTESVAWITERKNVLSASFYLASILSFLPAIKTEPLSRRRVLLTLGFYLLALLSKTVTVTLPITLLLIVYWRLEMISRQQAILITTMIILGLPFAAATIWLEREHVGATGTEWNWTIVERVRIAGGAFWFYWQKLIWPEPILFVYPKWDIESAISWLPSLAGVAVFIITGVLRWRGLLLCLIYFAATIFPALGLINIYPMRYTWAADHYQYLASIGPILLLSTLLTMVFEWITQATSREHRQRRTRGSLIALACYLGMLAYRTNLECEKYESALTLWHDTLAKDPQCEMAWVNLGNAYRQQNQLNEAANCYERAAKLNSGDAMPAINLASIVHVTGARDAAKNMYVKIMNTDRRGTWLARYNLAVLLMEDGELGEALELLERAAKEAPREAGIANARGLIAMKQSDFNKAITSFQRAVELSPYFLDARVNLGAAFKEVGRNEDAAREWTEVLSIDPQHQVAKHNLAAFTTKL